MKQTLNFLLMLVMVASVFSCKKKDVELTPAQKIVGKYKVTANTTTINSVVENNLTNEPACYTDNIWEFTTNFKTIISEGATSCPTPRPTQTVSYALASDGKTLTFTGTNTSGTNFTEAYIVQELTSAVLKISLTRTYVDLGVTITAKNDLTLTKI